VRIYHQSGAKEFQTFFISNLLTGYWEWDKRQYAIGQANKSNNTCEMGFTLDCCHFFFSEMKNALTYVFIYPVVIEKTLEPFIDSKKP
jgi:hypothetical protein